MGIYSVPTQNAVQKTLDTTLASGGTSLTLNESVAGLFSGVSATNPGSCVIDRVDSSGNETPSKREYLSFTGVSGATLSGLSRNIDGSGTDQEHSVGAIVEFVPDVSTFGSVKTTFENEHSADGTHSAVTATSVDIGSTIAITGVLDEDNMASDSAVKLATQQSIKAYVDAQASGTSLVDSNGADAVLTSATASAVNEITVTNAATGNGPLISATGDDTNVDLKLSGKGTGKVRVDARYGTITSDSDGATITFNMATSNLHTVTLGGNRTLALSNVSVGQTFILRLVQDGTGSRTVTWFSTIKWAGGSAPTLTTTANKLDVFGFICTSSGNYDGFVVGQNL